ncbi:MAG: RNA 2',3'-cyclic phosphodiesterase [Verrucomicrobia bacterium]|nr:MAG: RNA 2',3'-cyclic phosphodiesterase [Verrucomicrobiota bacterium]
MAASTAASVRAFIAIALEPGLVAELKKVQQELQARLPDDSVRWTQPEQLHLTLTFFGNVARENLENLTAALDRACAGIASFQLALENVGCFPHTKKPRVLWTGIGGELESLRKLQERIEQETGNFGDHKEERLFQPHLTIGRIKAFGIDTPRVGEVVERTHFSKLGGWTVRQIDLMQSELAPQGARHTTLAAITLAHSGM